MEHRAPARRGPALASLAALAATVAVAASAAPASAASGWHFGPLVKTWINDCYTVDVVNGVGEYAGAQYAADAPPKTGDVFYVNLVLNGIDASCAEQSFPEIKLPADMSPAISAAHPIACFKVDNATATETPDQADCPSSLGAPLYGGTGSIRDPNGAAPGVWDTRAPNAWEFRIPVTASRAGLHDLLFPTRVISGSITQMLEPTISVPVDQGTANQTTTKITLSSPARKAKLSKAGALKIPVSANVDVPVLARGTLSLRKAGKPVQFIDGHVNLKAGRAAKVSLKLLQRDATAVRNALRRRKKVTAKIVLEATGAGGNTITKMMKLRLVR